MFMGPTGGAEFSPSRAGTRASRTSFPPFSLTRGRGLGSSPAPSRGWAGHFSLTSQILRQTRLHVRAVTPQPALHIQDAGPHLAAIPLRPQPPAILPRGL